MNFRKSKSFKTIFALFIIFAIFLISIYFIPDQIILKHTQSKLYDSVELLPSNKVGLLLGTSKYARRGEINLYYKYRIDATVKLFENRKIEFVLISGDNGLLEYNEPLTIKNDLIRAGIPDSAIYLDYAGFRTWDSIIRAKKVFGENRFTVISQKFQNERAIFIGLKNEMEIIGYNAYDVSASYGFKTRVREKMARIKLFIDILVHQKPKYLGNTIRIGQ